MGANRINRFQDAVPFIFDTGTPGRRQTETPDQLMGQFLFITKVILPNGSGDWFFCSHSVSPCGSPAIPNMVSGISGFASRRYRRFAVCHRNATAERHLLLE
tara:strand:- start:5912 stop:6217 length:306 start_codon:yes stop_codon:yes gene_type:complete